MRQVTTMMRRALSQTPGSRNGSLACKKQNHNSSSLLCSEDMLKVCVDDNDNDIDHSSSQLPVHKALTCSPGQSARGSARSLVWRITRLMQKELAKVHLCKACATWDEVGLHMPWKWWCDSLTQMSVSGALFVVSVGCWLLLWSS